MLNHDASFCNIHGWIILDKPKELSSSKAVLKAKKILNVKKAGHAGTLDPFATGVLPVALGEATKTIAYIQDALKGHKIKITKLAQGLPVGGEIESLDDGTLIYAFKNRKSLIKD